MRSLSIFLALVFIATVTGCAPEPVANFNFTYERDAAPAEVNFNNLSTDADTYRWDFGDGGSSTEANPRYIYTTPGTYNVVLYAKGRGGESNTAQSITIRQATSYIVKNQSSYALYAVTSYAQDENGDLVEGTQLGNLFSGDNSEEVFTDYQNIWVYFENSTGTLFGLSTYFILSEGFRNNINLTDEVLEAYLVELSNAKSAEKGWQDLRTGTDTPGIPAQKTESL
jgi:PKD repeat protein